MNELIKKIIFAALLLWFMTWAFFLWFLDWFKEIISGFNSTLWVNIPFELRIWIIGFICVIIIAIIHWAVYE